jgi:hypothetical protein
MRQFFFETKISNRFTVDVAPEAMDWAWHLRRHTHYRRWVFHPVQAELPDFDWKTAAHDQFTEENLELLELARTLPFFNRPPDRVRELAARYNGQSMFDVRQLETFYASSVDLAYFVARNTSIHFGSKRVDYYHLDGPPPALLAFCTLLLFVSQWRTNEAIGKFAKIVTAPEPRDVTLGNVIGLNPFHNYASWRFIMGTREIAVRSSKGFDYPGQLKSIEARLRQQYRAWKASPSKGATDGAFD